MAKDTMFFLADFFAEQIYKWLSQSPDLGPLDYFLWSYLKNIVNKDAPRSTAEFKKKTEDAIREIDTTMCRKLAEKDFFKSGEC